MELQTIDVYIDESGNVSIELDGFKGMSCTDVTKALEEALGGDVISREMTHEAYEAPQTLQDYSQQQDGDG